MQYYSSVYDVAYIKVKNNNIKSINTDVILFSSAKRPIKHRVTYEGVTLEKMFKELQPNKLYDIKELIEKSGEYG